MDKIRVAVRVRPFNRREKELGSKSIVTMSGMQTILHHPTALDKPDRFIAAPPRLTHGLPSPLAPYAESGRGDAEGRGGKVCVGRRGE
ncbi:uncharacterized protein LOC135100756 isoform X1 [Scylla paramamosain]|uniref:uncharacterized protein LOC135100756 isoform X1 n=1 Tax=Scylla paramamosain TaxID=85552 RepID=UPI003083BABB